MALGASAASTGAAGCDMLHAVYRAADDPHFTLTAARLASHSGVVSDIGLHLQSKNPEDESWWYFDQGSGHWISLISTLDPTVTGWVAEPDGGTRVHGALTFIGMNVKGDILEDSPQSKTLAPYYVIIPQLSEAYRKHQKQHSAGAFVLSGCRR